MANPNLIFLLPPLPGAVVGGASQYTDTVLTDTQGVWNTYIIPSGIGPNIGVALSAPSTAVVKLQATVDSIAAVSGQDTLAEAVTLIAATSYTGWSVGTSGGVITFTADSTGARDGTYNYDNGQTGVNGSISLTTQGKTAVNAVDTLTILTPAIANGNVGVALNGGSNVDTAVLLGDTAAQVATKIAASIFTGYVVTNPSPGVVVFTASTPGPQVGANTLTPNATGVTGTLLQTTAGVTAVAAIAKLTLTSGASQVGTVTVKLNGVAFTTEITESTSILWVDVPNATSTGGTAYIGGISYPITALRSYVATALASNKATVSIRTNGAKYW